eukprot:UN25831
MEPKSSLSRKSDLELTNWPPKETHDKFVNTYKIITMENLGKPINVNAVYFTIKQFLQVLRTLFVWHKASLPFWTEGVVISKLGGTKTESIKYSTIFPTFRTFDPDAFTVSQLQEKSTLAQVKETKCTNKI